MDPSNSKLLANGRAQRAAIENNQDALDFKPVVKLFTPDAQCTWLLTEHLTVTTPPAFGPVVFSFPPFLRRSAKADRLRSLYTVLCARRLESPRVLAHCEGIGRSYLHQVLANDH